jgi:hypothetical protein
MVQTSQCEGVYVHFSGDYNNNHNKGGNMIRAGDRFTCRKGFDHLAACDEGPGGLVLIAGVIMTVIESSECKVWRRASDKERLRLLRHYAEHDDGPRGILAKRQLEEEFAKELPVNE